MLFAVATYISSMFSFPSYHFMCEFRFHLHYIFLIRDTEFYHFILNVCTGTLEVAFFILDMKESTDFLKELCLWTGVFITRKLMMYL